MLEGKHILLGVTGSIAAYKATQLVRLLKKAGAEVQVVMTPCAKDFITPVTLSALSGRPVLSEFSNMTDGSWNSHVELGMWADVMLVAPATASTIAKMAAGIADNLLTTCYLSCKAPVVVAPAMDLDMYAHPATRRNLDTLHWAGNRIIEPGEGFLASGLTGKGRMEEPERIVERLEALLCFEQRLAGRRALVTAGPTYEQIDPVRFIGNYSSGKMGFALAAQLAAQGADVILVTGPVALPTPAGNIHRVDVRSAEQMYQEAAKYFPQADIAVFSAAVADFTPAQVREQKTPRAQGMTLELRPTRDIAAELGREKRPGQFLVGFALETDAGRERAREKMREKHLDLIVLNSLSDPGAGFACDTNKVTILSSDGGQWEYPLKDKKEVARDIVERIP